MRILVVAVVVVVVVIVVVVVKSFLYCIHRLQGLGIHRENTCRSC